jgi:hypothetical protein
MTTNEKALRYHLISEQVKELEDRREQLEVQLAGCSTAAMGSTRDPAKEGDYGWSPAYHDVLTLRIAYDKLRAETEAKKYKTTERLDVIDIDGLARQTLYGELFTFTDGVKAFALAVANAVLDKLSSKAMAVTHPAYMKFVTTSQIEELKATLERQKKREPKRPSEVL